MAGLGLRYCQNHPEIPLVLVSNGQGNFWACEHPDGCQYTESLVPGSQRPVSPMGRVIRRRNQRAPRRLR